MAIKKRRFSTFSLSFLDIMSCGFGAVVLIFLIIKHEADDKVDAINQDMLSEVNLLEEDIREGEKGLVRARNTLSTVDQQLAEARGLARQINDDILTFRNRINELDDSDNDQQVKKLEEQLRGLESEKKRLEQEQQRSGNDVRRFLGQGDRQYLTGLKLGGARILILVDSSTSMLDETLVNIIIRRNMSSQVKRNSAKWLQAVKIVQWLTAQLPPESHFQLYTFNTNVKPAVDGSEGQWLNIGNKEAVEKAVANLQNVVPEGGTSLENVFASINNFEQLPDNIFLITDGLPTQGRKAKTSGTVNGKEREKLFSDAVEAIPFGIPVNTVLLPMEGDPYATAAYWRLAQVSGGSFITPSEDWP